MSTTEPLFDATPYTVDPPTTSTTPDRTDLSAGQRLTLRQTNDITNGRHPLHGAPLHDRAPLDATRTDRGRSFTCGDCCHRAPAVGHYHWPKCDIGPQTRGPATDVRAWWPACTHWEGLTP